MNHDDNRINWDAAQIDYWNAIAEGYDNLYDDPWSKAENDDTRLLLSRLIEKPNANVLDLACGTGLGYALAKSTRSDIQYFGVDISPNMLAKCRQRWPDLEVKCRPMNDLATFSNEYFDTVFCLYTSFSFTDKPIPTLREIHRVLKKNGGVLVSVINRWSLRRLLSKKVNEIENYRTRNSEILNYSVPAQTYSRGKLKSLLEASGFRGVTVQGQGFLAGVIQSPSFWRIDLALSKIIPDLCHTFNATARKQ